MSLYGIKIILEKSIFILNTKKATLYFSPFQFPRAKPPKSILLRYNVGRGEENVCK